MAEPKTKGSAESKSKVVNGNGNQHGLEKSPNKQSKLRQLLALAREVGKDAEAIQDHDNMVEGHKMLEQELETRTTELQRLRDWNETLIKDFHEYKTQAGAKNETLMAEFEQRYKTYESNKAAVETMEKEVAQMKEKLDASEALQKAKVSEAEKLKQQLKSADLNAKSQAAEMKEISADCELHRSRMEACIGELDTCKIKLSRAQSDLGEDLLHDYDAEGLKKLGMELRDLSKQCHILVKEFFSDEGGAEAAASEIEELKARFPKIPLSTTASTSAARMRCAVAEAVIADVLMNQIFVPFYLPAQTRSAASTLLDIFGDDERRRTIYRCQILQSMTDTEEVARVQDEIVRKASSEVRNKLQGLVMAFRQAGFFVAVPNLFKEAQALWVAVQRSRDFIAAEQPDMNEVQPPGKYDYYDENGAGGSPSPSRKGGKGGAAKAQIAAVLFPQVATREDLIFNGMALWSNQAALVTAAPDALMNGANGGSRPSRRRSVVSPSRDAPHWGRAR